MKHLMIWIMSCSLVMSMGLAAMAETTKDTDDASSSWVDITDKLFANPADEPGWEEDAAGKVFRNGTGSQLKIVTTQFGSMLVDLTSTTVFKLEANDKTELQGVKMFQRDHGRSIVIRNDTFKIRCRISEKVEGMKNIPGIRAM